MSFKTISVIIPVYNTEQYLVRCVESVLAQRYTDLEIILVDDGSSDGSGALCDALAVRDHRVRTIHKENGGAGSARNAGLDLCRGEYVCFLDSDDTLTPDALARLGEEINKTDADIYLFQMRRIETDGKSYLHVPQGPRGVPMTLADRPEMLLWPAEACGALWRRALFADSGIRFGAWRVGEDVSVTRRLLAVADSVVLLPDALYNYIRRKQSATQGDLDLNRDVMGAMEDIVLWYERAGLFERYREELSAFCTLHVFYYASLRILRVTASHPLLGQLRAYTCRRFPEHLKNRYVRGWSRSRRLALRMMDMGLYLPLHMLYRRDIASPKQKITLGSAD